MRDFRDAKAMAQTLRTALSEKNISVSHSECLELIARQFGTANWNTLSAKIQAEPRGSDSMPAKIPKKTTVPPALKRGMTFPMVPLRDIVIFPQMVCPLFMGREKSLRAVQQAAKGDGRIFLVAQRSARDDNPSAGQLYMMGVVADLLQQMTAPDGSLLS